MAQFYGVYDLLENKNRLHFSFEDREEIVQILKEAPHFRDILCEDSKAQISKIYKCSVLRKFEKHNFIYHESFPLNNLFTLLYGKVACFYPRTIEDIKNQEALLNELKYKDVKALRKGLSKEMIRSAEQALENYKNKDDEMMLRSDPSKIQLYFDGDICLFKRIKVLLPGDSFGIYTPYHQASYISLEDSAMLMIPGKNYEKLFAPEVERFNFVTAALAKVFCRNEEKVGAFFQEQQEEMQQIQSPDKKNPLKLRRQGSIKKMHFLNSFCSQEDEQEDDKVCQQEDENIDQIQSTKKDSLIKLYPVDSLQSLENTLKRQKSSSLSPKKRDKFINKAIGFRDEERINGVTKALKCSEISFYFELQFCDEEYQTMLYEENDEVAYYYLVVSGNLLLKKEGAKEAIKIYGPQELVGFEDASNKRIFSCVADKGTVIYCILKDKFEINLSYSLFTYFKELQKATKKQLLFTAVKSGFTENELQSIMNSVHFSSQTKEELMRGYFDSNEENNAKYNKKANLISKRVRSEGKELYFSPNIKKQMSKESKESDNNPMVSFKRVVLAKNENIPSLYNFQSILSTPPSTSQKRKQKQNSPMITEIYPQIGSESKQVNQSKKSRRQHSTQNIMRTDNNNVITISPFKHSFASPFSSYEKLNTFSNVYHKQKQIIALSLSKHTDNHNSKHNNNNPFDHNLVISHEQDIQNYNQTQRGFSFQHNLTSRNRTATQHALGTILDTGGSNRKEFNLKQIEVDVERSILNIPKSFQNKLWGKKRVEALQQLFNKKY